jgi:protein phosphatase
MYFVHLGDSRIYYLPKSGPMVQVTHDHSHVGWLRRNGKINEREARTHPRRNALQQALGAGQQFIDPHIGAVGHSAGDKFLLCSDGVIDGLWDRQLEETIRTPPIDGDSRSPAHQLVDQAVQNSGRDNATAVVVELVQPRPASSPSPA